MSSSNAVHRGWADFQLDLAREIKAELATARANDDPLMVEVKEMKLARHYADARPTMERIAQSHLPEVVKSYRRWRERERVGARKGGQS